jgi:AcrR family transcriptional regulator
MSKKTIYQFYADKDELVDAVVVNEVSNIECDCTSCLIDAKDAIHEIFLTMERILEQMRNINPMVLYDLEKFHYKAFQRFQKHKQEFVGKIIAENIERGIKEELYRPEVNVDIMAKFRIETMMFPFNIDLFPPKKFNHADVAQEIIEHFVYGLATSKGHKQIQKYKLEFHKKISSNEK